MNKSDKNDSLTAYIHARKLPLDASQMTIETLSALWCRGDLAHRFPDHVAEKKSASEDMRRFQWLHDVRMPDGALFGERRVIEITLDDCEHVMTSLPPTTLAASTRRHYAQLIRKLLALSVFPLRIRESLPIPTGWLPRARCEKAKSWIYPSEDLLLMKCIEVPLARRLFFGLLAREGMRVSEAVGLNWSDVDLVRGVVKLDLNKTDDPRTWALGTDVVAALHSWRKRRVDEVRVFPSAGLGDRGDFANQLRESLKRAGVTREELFVPQPNRLLLRAHDLRGSFVTLALAAGRTEAWVTDRTGHRSSAMIYNYKRGARTATELGLGWFAPLNAAIPDLERRDVTTS